MERDKKEEQYIYMILLALSGRCSRVPGGVSCRGVARCPPGGWGGFASGAARPGAPVGGPSSRCQTVLRGSGCATAIETGPVRARLSGEVPPTSRAPPGEDGGRPGFTQAAPTLGRWGAPSRKGVPVPVRRVEHNGTCRSLFAQEAAGASRANDSFAWGSRRLPWCSRGRAVL